MDQVNVPGTRAANRPGRSDAHEHKYSIDVSCCLRDHSFICSDSQVVGL